MARQLRLLIVFSMFVAAVPVTATLGDNGEQPTQQPAPALTQRADIARMASPSVSLPGGPSRRPPGNPCDRDAARTFGGGGPADARECNAGARQRGTRSRPRGGDAAAHAIRRSVECADHITDDWRLARYSAARGRSTPAAGLTGEAERDGDDQAAASQPAAVNQDPDEQLEVRKQLLTPPNLLRITVAVAAGDLLVRADATRCRTWPGPKKRSSWPSRAA